MVKVIVDVMGADATADVLVKGALNAINKFDDIFIYLVGDENIIKDTLNSFTFDKTRVEIIPSTDVITNNDDPRKVIFDKKESSMIKGINYLKSHDDISGMISCGSTGALIGSSIFKLGKLSDIRPCLGCYIPNNKGTYFCLVDCGATIDCSPNQLVQFAKMGEIFVKCYYGIKNPRIGLLSNGVEESKGNAMVKNAHALLKNEDLNFIGNIEASALLDDLCDVVVCDGFDGNIVLKNVEGTAKSIIKGLIKSAKEQKDEQVRNITLDIAKSLMNQYDLNSLGGAMIFGITKIVVKGHGAANSTTIVSTIEQVYKLAKTSFIKDMIDYIG